MARPGLDHDRGGPRRGRRRPWLLSVAALAAVALTVAACGSSSSSGTSSGSSAGTSANAGTSSANTASSSNSTGAAPAGKPGGTLTVLEGSNFIGDYPQGLDPATNLDTLLANASLMDAIYGELFEVGAHNTLIPDLATGYAFSDGGKTLTIHLRPGVKFSDGTPFNAAAVVFNFKRDLGEADPANPPWPKYKSLTAPNPTTVVVKFPTPDGAAINELLDTTLSWIVSPTALKKLGEAKFRDYPVGAGPFTVVSDTLSTKLVLKKNPHYWEPGHPLLDGLTFVSVSNDETALESLEAHNAQAYEYMTTPQLVSSYKSAGYNVTADPGTATLDVQINAGVAPFNNLLAREAISYATDSAAIDQKLYLNTCTLSESFTGPGGLFFDPKVPNYRSYNLAKAKALVKQLGGLSFTMYYLSSPLNAEEGTALETMFEAAGMKVTLKPIADLAAFVAEYNTHKWQVIPASIGSYDPAGGIGVSFRLASNGPFTGIHDSTVDKYITEGAQAVATSARAAAYANLANYLNQKAYTPFICAPTSWDIAAKNVSGPGLTTAYGGFGEGPLVQWENVSVNG